MKIKIFKTIQENFGKALKLYPVSLSISAVITALTFVSIYITTGKYLDYEMPNHQYWNDLLQQVAHWILVLSFVYVLSIGVANAIRINPSWKRYRWIGYGTALTVGILLHFLIPVGFKEPTGSAGTFDFLWLDIFIYGLSAHLVAAILPFIRSKRNSNQLLWRYNQGLLTQFIVAGLYAGILYGGIALSIFTFNLLIIKGAIPDEFFAYMAALVFILGHAFIFAINCTEDGENWVEEQHNYTKVLKNLVRYILIPIIALYLIILYMYMAKITWLWSLPKGIVSLMTMVFSVVGYFTVLISYPFQFEEDNKWLSNVYRRFSWLLLPLMPLLFIALYVRISEYGFTELRVALTYLDVWLLLITGYYAFVKKPNILVLPLTLLVLTLAARFLPKYNFHRWSVESQETRLLGYLSTLKMYNEGDTAIKQFDRVSYFKNWTPPSTLPPIAVLRKENEIYLRETTFGESIEAPAVPAGAPVTVDTAAASNTTKAVESDKTNGDKTVADNVSGTVSNPINPRNGIKKLSDLELQQRYFIDSISYEIQECLNYLCTNRNLYKIENSSGKPIKLIDKPNNDNEYTSEWQAVSNLIAKWELPVITYKNRYSESDATFTEANYAEMKTYVWNKPITKEQSSLYQNKIIIPISKNYSTFLQEFQYSKNGKNVSAYLGNMEFNDEAIVIKSNKNSTDNELTIYLREKLKDMNIMKKLKSEESSVVGVTTNTINMESIDIPLRWNGLTITLHFQSLGIETVNNEFNQINYYSGFAIIE
jgi:hypothetical protein